MITKWPQFIQVINPSHQDISRWAMGFHGIRHMAMNQYLLIPFLVGWTSICQLFWGSLGTKVLTHCHIKTTSETFRWISIAFFRSLLVRSPRPTEPRTGNVSGPDPFGPPGIGGAEPPSILRFLWQLPGIGLMMVNGSWNLIIAIRYLEAHWFGLMFHELRLSVEIWGDGSWISVVYCMPNAFDLTWFDQIDQHLILHSIAYRYRGVRFLPPVATS